MVAAVWIVLCSDTGLSAEKISWAHSCCSASHWKASVREGPGKEPWLSAGCHAMDGHVWWKPVYFWKCSSRGLPEGRAWNFAGWTINCRSSDRGRTSLSSPGQRALLGCYLVITLQEDNVISISSSQPKRQMPCMNPTRRWRGRKPSCPKGGSCGHAGMVGCGMQKYRCSKGWEDV